MFSDATRFWTDAEGLDFDVNTNPSNFGSFTTTGPMFERSTAFGRGNNNAQSGANLELTFRHGNNQINTAKFDGSVSSMTDKEAWTDPNPWYPTGTIWTEGSVTEESREFMERQARGRSVIRIE